MSSGANKLTRRYRKETLRAMEPKERLSLTFDLAWKAANNGDEMRLLQLLMLLRKAIRFDENPIIAMDALRLYSHCEWLIKEKQDFPSVAHVFFELKRALCSAVDMPQTPEELARREKVRDAASKGILYFGKNGVHYGPKPNQKSVRITEPNAAKPAESGEHLAK